MLERRVGTVPQAARSVRGGSFEEFFREHHRRLFQAMYLLTGSVPESDDLAQEALLRIFERWERVSRMQRTEGYLYRTALNLHRSRLRRAARWRRRLASEIATDDPTPHADTRLDVRRALRSLPPGQREAIVLVDWVGFSPEEVGRMVGSPPGTVRSRLHRGRRALHKTLGGAHD